MQDADVFAVILAGGTGTRMGNVDKPKQFMKIGGKAILIHTIEKFLVNESFTKIIVLAPKAWINHSNDLIKRHVTNTDKISVIEGGATRNDTIMNAIDYIEKNHRLTEDTIIVTHDSVRPFVTHRIIEENIRYAREFSACDTVISATDTIVESDDNNFIKDIPARANMYQGQTPQSFKAKKLKKLYESLSESQKENLTDACKIFVLLGEQVHLVEGEVFNIKITYPYDICVANSMLEGGE